MGTAALSPGRRLPPQPRTAIIGASGLVGSALLQLLNKHHFPMASCLEWSPRDFSAAALPPLDLVFWAAPAELARREIPPLVEQGIIVVDLSSAWRMNAKSCLIQRGINQHLLRHHQGLLSCPNCTNVGLVQVLHALLPVHPFFGVDVHTYQAASGGGRRLLQQIHASSADSSLFQNVIPLCDFLQEDGSTAEERRLVEETKALLQRPDLSISATCVRVPTAIGHALSLSLYASTPWPLAAIKKALKSAPLLQLYPDGLAPTPRSIENPELVHVGRIRLGASPKILQMWIVFDNLNMGAASQALWIAQALLP